MRWHRPTADLIFPLVPISSRGSVARERRRFDGCST